MEEGFRLNIKLILARIFIGSGGRIPAAYGQQEIRKILKVPESAKMIFQEQEKSCG